MKFPKGVAGMDSLNKHVEQISFRQCVTLWEHRQLKGWQPHFQPTIAESSISATAHWFAAVTGHNSEHNHCIVTFRGDHNSVTKPSASLHETGFFLQLQQRDGHDATTMWRWWSVLPLSGTCFWQGVDD